MANLNEVRLIGRLTRDPELRSTATGQYVCNLGLATNRKYRRSDGVYEDETTYIDIACWGRTAETAGKYLRKGKLIFISGRLKFDSWVDKQTGQKRSKLSVVADNFQFLERADSDGGGQSYAPSGGYAPQANSGYGSSGGGFAPQPQQQGAPSSPNDPPFREDWNSPSPSNSPPAWDPNEMEDEPPF